MKFVEKVELTDQEYEDYSKYCKALQRSLRGQTTMLIRQFIKTVKNEN